MVRSSSLLSINYIINALVKVQPVTFVINLGFYLLYFHCWLVIDLPGYMPIFKNMPPVAGGLTFAQQLQERIQKPYNNFRFINHP